VLIFHVQFYNDTLFFRATSSLTGIGILSGKELRCFVKIAYYHGLKKLDGNLDHQRNIEIE
jgi:hypothetical protein